MFYLTNGVTNLSNVFATVASLGRDAEFSTIGQSGTPCLTISLAVNTGFGDRQKTMWVRGSIFGKRAESNLKDYLKKGQQVHVVGELSLNEFTTKDGVNKTIAELNINQIDLIGKREQSAPPPQPAPPKPVQQPQHIPQSGGYDEDIPF